MAVEEYSISKKEIWRYETMPLGPNPNNPWDVAFLDDPLFNYRPVNPVIHNPASMRDATPLLGNCPRCGQETGLNSVGLMIHYPIGGVLCSFREE